jgi:hypothetical protein
MSGIVEILLRRLYQVASLGDHKAAERLLEFDTCNAYVLNKNGHSPLHVAAKNGHANAIERIIHCCPDSGELLDLNGRCSSFFPFLVEK